MEAVSLLPELFIVFFWRTPDSAASFRPSSLWEIKNKSSPYLEQYALCLLQQPQK